MADLRRTPSVQHAVALMRDTVAATRFEMEKLDAAKINISLNPGRRLFKPMMEGQPVAWAIRQVEAEKAQQNIKPNTELVEAFAPYALEKSVTWFRPCELHGYPIGAGVIIPVRPVGFWAEQGQLRVLWPQCWKGRTLDPLQKAIFHTILRETFLVGDFKPAQLQWVDLRERSLKKGRELEVLPGEALGTVPIRDLTEYLRILLTAFEEHHAAKQKRKAEEKSKSRTPPEAPLFKDYLD